MAISVPINEYGHAQFDPLGPAPLEFWFSFYFFARKAFRLSSLQGIVDPTHDLISPKSAAGWPVTKITHLAGFGASEHKE